jgi:hypothetical protein
MSDQVRWNDGHRFYGRMRDGEEDSVDSEQIDNEHCLANMKATAKALKRQNKRYKVRNAWLRKAVEGFTGQTVQELYPKELSQSLRESGFQLLDRAKFNERVEDFSHLEDFEKWLETYLPTEDGSGEDEGTFVNEYQYNTNMRVFKTHSEVISSGVGWLFVNIKDNECILTPVSTEGYLTLVAE